MPEIKSKNNKGKKVLVALSGGVDSSVATALLIRAGYDVATAHIKTGSIDEQCANQDLEDARKTANFLEVPFYVFDFSDEYQKKIIDYFVSSYKKGLTPSPDVLCNKEIKFGIFLKKAKSLGMDFIATGHYARIFEKNNYKILKGVDKNKDQSYFLWQLSQDQLAHSLFPIGDYLKSEVREMAKKFGLPTAEKKDSQGICFLGKVDVFDFLKKYLPISEGDIILPNGKVVGKHQGSFFYTIGQRQGLGLSYSQAGFDGGEPIYIVDKDLKKNIIVVDSGKNNPLLFKKTIWLDNLNFISGEFPNKPMKISAIIRYRQEPIKAVLDFDNTKNKWRVIFSNPVWAVAQGQHLVFFNKDELLGGGIIMNSE